MRQKEEARLRAERERAARDEEQAQAKMQFDEYMRVIDEKKANILQVRLSLMHP